MKRGSALLVVLGMLAFMLFSGLAFSVYMRQSRLPTSFLRRTVTTRQLAKAALAEAIEEIDTAIGNDPHPGVLSSNTRQECIGNIWDHRVFVGYSEANTSCSYAKELGLAEDSANSQDSGQVDFSKLTYLADPSDTVPTLTLEGLAYLPPNLINEVRYYSQRTATAKWHSFWFDSGRYAYTAVDVSDYFDINRVYANKPRSSSNRISFAHLFETGGAEHSGAGGKNANAWDDDFMKEYRPVDEKGNAKGNFMPLISLADFNVAFGNGKAGFKNPFRNFLEGNTLYEKEDPDSQEVEKYRGMTFVTDGWFPDPPDEKNKTAAGVKKVDLEDDQPFDMDLLLEYDKNRGYSVIMEQLATGEGTVGYNLKSHLNPVTLASLWDYLDKDSVPFSLAIPTTERVPMICGIQPVVGQAKFVIKQEQEGEDKEAPNGRVENQYIKYRRTYAYKLDVSELNNLEGVRVLLTYPFLDRGLRENDQTSYDMKGMLAIFLSDNSKNVTVPLRTYGGVSGLSIGDENKKFDVNKMLGGGVAVRSFTASGIDTTMIEEREDRCCETPINVNQSTGEIQPNADGDVLFKVTYEWIRDVWEEVNGKMQLVVKKYPNPNLAVDGGDLLDAETVIGDLGWFTATEKGEVNRTHAKGDKVKFSEEINGKELRVNVAAWVSVNDSNGHVVDLVPARMSDDEKLDVNKGDNMKLPTCDNAPLMRFNGPTFKIELKEKMELPISLSISKAVVSDPRFNYAPENWFTVGSGNLEPKDWLDNQNCTGTDRDGDIYMATSDQGYLQSVYELAFLPRINDGFDSPDFDADWVEVTGDPLKYGPDIPSSFGDTMSKDFAWTTYRPYPYGKNGWYDDFNVLGIVSGEERQKVNPYSDSENVIMAAFANAPMDWRVAATNYEETAIGQKMKSYRDKGSEFNEKYAWNDYSANTTVVCWKHLKEVASNFISDVHNAGSWEAPFRNLGWSTEKNDLIVGSQLPKEEDHKFYSVDKKFLYGFWHDSFSARQQLFLIFVRAEPMMMGGGLSGQVPPQLSARAVALVWRDPTETAKRSGDGNDNSGGTLYNPHRTRILFYHQFD